MSHYNLQTKHHNEMLSEMLEYMLDRFSCSGCGTVLNEEAVSGEGLFRGQLLRHHQTIRNFENPEWLNRKAKHEVLLICKTCDHKGTVLVDNPYCSDTMRGEGEGI